MTARRLAEQTRTAIEELVRDGAPSRAIARRLGVNRSTVAAVRSGMGLPPQRSARRTFPTLVAAFRGRTEPAGAGHLRWTGRIAQGVPVFWHRRQQYSAYRVAFTLRTGRPPDGPVKPECGQRQCVEPTHVDDTATRQRDRAMLAALLGRPEPAERCAQGHDRAVHGRLLPDGRPYCNACARGQREARP
ncbi:hypothetical protein AABB02_33670 [Streptomyces rimosus]|uniref:helix-turn-helix domain-containing protein n=1 Tax=Streptomyces rimosus TaxID=1927 RepID=UPI0031DB43B1